jgi:hypothetical protein
MKKACAEPDVDDKGKKKPPMKKKGKAVTKVKPQWAGIADKMLGGQ